MNDLGAVDSAQKAKKQSQKTSFIVGIAVETITRKTANATRRSAAKSLHQHEMSIETSRRVTFDEPLSAAKRNEYQNICSDTSPIGKVREAAFIHENGGHVSFDTPQVSFRRSNDALPGGYRDNEKMVMSLNSSNIDNINSWTTDVAKKFVNHDFASDALTRMQGKAENYYDHSYNSDRVRNAVNEYKSGYVSKPVQNVRPGTYSNTEALKALSHHVRHISYSYDQDLEDFYRSEDLRGRRENTYTSKEYHLSNPVRYDSISSNTPEKSIDSVSSDKRNDDVIRRSEMHHDERRSVHRRNENNLSTSLSQLSNNRSSYNEVPSNRMINGKQAINISDYGPQASHIADIDKRQISNASSKASFSAVTVSLGHNTSSNQNNIFSVNNSGNELKKSINHINNQNPSISGIDKISSASSGINGINNQKPNGFFPDGGSISHKTPNISGISGRNASNAGMSIQANGYHIFKENNGNRQKVLAAIAAGTLFAGSEIKKAQNSIHSNGSMNGISGKNSSFELGQNTFSKANKNAMPNAFSLNLSKNTRLSDLSPSQRMIMQNSISAISGAGGMRKMTLSSMGRGTRVVMLSPKNGKINSISGIGKTKINNFNGNSTFGSVQNSRLKNIVKNNINNTAANNLISEKNAEIMAKKSAFGNRSINDKSIIGSTDFFSAFNGNGNQLKDTVKGINGITKNALKGQNADFFSAFGGNRNQLQNIVNGKINNAGANGLINEKMTERAAGAGVLLNGAKKIKIPVRTAVTTPKFGDGKFVADPFNPFTSPKSKRMIHKQGENAGIKTLNGALLGKSIQKGAGKSEKTVADAAGKITGFSKTSTGKFSFASANKAAAILAARNGDIPLGAMNGNDVFYGAVNNRKTLFGRKIRGRKGNVGLLNKVDGMHMKLADADDVANFSGAFQNGGKAALVFIGDKRTLGQTKFSLFQQSANKYGTKASTNQFTLSTEGENTFVHTHRYTRKSKGRTLKKGLGFAAVGVGAFAAFTMAGTRLAKSVEAGDTVTPVKNIAKRYALRGVNKVKRKIVKALKTFFTQILKIVASLIAPIFPMMLVVTVVIAIITSFGIFMGTTKQTESDSWDGYDKLICEVGEALDKEQSDASDKGDISNEGGANINYKAMFALIQGYCGGTPTYNDDDKAEKADEIINWMKEDNYKHLYKKESSDGTTTFTFYDYKHIKKELLKSDIWKDRASTTNEESLDKAFDDASKENSDKNKKEESNTDTSSDTQGSSSNGEVPPLERNPNTAAPAAPAVTQPPVSPTAPPASTQG